MLGSNASCPCNHDDSISAQACLLNSDEDAKKIHDTFVRDAKFMSESQAKLILSSGCCNKERVLDIIKEQISNVSGEDSLYVFVYRGRACDKWNHRIGFEVKTDKEECVEVSPDLSTERYSLVVNQYDFSSPEASLTGRMIGSAIGKGKPSQVFVILECPHASGIASALRESLSDTDYLELIVPQGRKTTPSYAYSLKCSAFTYFFSLFVSRAEYITGMFPMRKVLGQVKECCKALSCLDMVADTEWIRANSTIPEEVFMRIPRRAEIELNAEENGEETDGLFELKPLIDKFKSWKKSFLQLFDNKGVRICQEAIDWVRAVTEVYLSALKDEEVLEGAVLEAAIDSIVSSLVVIQVQKEGSIASLSFFVDAYMLAISAVDFVSPKNEALRSKSLLASAVEYYTRVNELSDQEKDTFRKLTLP